MAEGKVDVVEQVVEVVEGESPNVTIEVTEQAVVVSEAVVGVQGPPGPIGPPGDGSDKHYEHTQSTPSAVWTISHNLGKRPAVTVIDSGGNEWQTAVEHISANECVVRFSAPFSGAAYLN